MRLYHRIASHGKASITNAPAIPPGFIVLGTAAAGKTKRQVITRTAASREKLKVDKEASMADNYRLIPPPEWRNWQTRGIQNPVLATG
ncbi:MAG: hypothetical protein JSW27_14975, partial [Phycisphaerales bacterium]